MNLNFSDELEIFYKTKFNFSYSSINKLLFSPSMFYNHYILNKREDSNDTHLVAGKLVHCLLLEPHKFEENFITLPGKLPGASNKALVDKIFKNHLKFENNTLELSDYKDEILAELVAMNLHQSLKTDQQRLDKILLPENIEYFEFLKLSMNKSVIDQTILNGCKESVEMIKLNKDVTSLLQLDEEDRDPNISVFNEIELDTDVKGLPFGLKGIIDNIVIDKSSNTIFINDIKTTGKPLQDFKDSVDYYRYWIQVAVYVKLVKNKLLNLTENKKDWKIQFTFIVIDKYNLVYPYQVSDETLTIWEERFDNEIVPQVKWHYENKRFDLPYELALGNVKL